MTPPSPEIAARIEQQWREVDHYLADETRLGPRRFLPLVPLLKADPVLGHLYPFIGVSGFGFSRCCDYPYYCDIVIGTEKSGLYSARVTGGTGGWTFSWVIAEGDGPTVIDALKRFIPEDYPPPILGSAEELRPALENEPFTIRLRREYGQRHQEELKRHGLA